MPSPLGFIIGTDRYFKRDDCGIIYQLCIEPGQRRSLVGAMLVKAMFDRSAYGCRLFCCWCAQDIEANHFWESLGFVPLAYRAGSQKKARVHIFWQKRIRAGDEETPWWFPSQTTGGSIRQDRIVLPIPPGTHWSEARPLILPTTPATPAPVAEAPRPALPGPRPSKPGKRAERPKREPHVLCGFRFAEPAPPPAPKPAPQKRPRVKTRVKNSPLHIAAARELRDRWLEQVNSDPTLLLPRGKYPLARALPAGLLPLALPEIKALPEAA